MNRHGRVLSKRVRPNRLSLDRHRMHRLVVTESLSRRKGIVSELELTLLQLPVVFRVVPRRERVDQGREPRARTDRRKVGRQHGAAKVGRRGPPVCRRGGRRWSRVQRRRGRRASDAEQERDRLERRSACPSRRCLCSVHRLSGDGHAGVRDRSCTVRPCHRLGGVVDRRRRSFEVRSRRRSDREPSKGLSSGPFPEARRQ
jgi:hypothetical protein